MPWQMDTSARVDELSEAIFALVSEGGLEAVTYRSVAELVRMSPSSLHNHFPRMPHLVRLAAARLARQRSLRLAESVPRCGLGAMLPETERELMESIVRAAFQSGARHDVMLAHQMVRDIDDDLHVVAGALGRPAADPACRAVLATVEGLSHARTLGEDPLGLPEARALLDLTVTALTRPTAAA